VLAFDNFDGRPETNYFADGLAEEILNLLASLPELSVAARTSSFRFRGKQLDIREIAQLLGVKYVLEGSVRQHEDRIRTTAQLIDGSQGFHDWSNTYDRELDDIFSIQEEIAQAVVNELKIKLSVESEEILQRKPTDNIDAYIYYLQGKDRLRSSLDADVITTAIQLFDSALDIDTDFFLALAGKCEAHLRLYQISNDVNDFQTAEAACSSAGKLDPGLNAEINLALGMLYRYRGWYDKAEKQLEIAIASGPKNADAYIELGEIRLDQNRYTEAEALFLRATDLKRYYWKAHKALASFYYRSERYRESAEVYEMVTALTPDVAAGFASKGAVYSMLGEAEKAQAALNRSLELKPSRQAYTNLGLSYYHGGQFEQAAEMQTKALEYAPEDHRVWGRLAESLRFIDGQEEQSAFAYQRASELAEENLEINELDWTTTGLLGLYTYHLGRPEEALELVETAVDISQRNPQALYFQGLVLLQSGDREAALAVLEEAIAADDRYRQIVTSDPDLISVKEVFRKPEQT
jgi:TolB-like protein/Flp pilus assembly protein TadD